MRSLTATCLAGLMLLSGCSATLGHYGNSHTALNERATLIIGAGVVVEKVEGQAVWDAQGGNFERQMTLDPGLRTLKVRYAKKQNITFRFSTVSHDFQPGVVYRIAAVPIDEGKSVSFVIAPEKEKEKKDKADTLPVQ